MSIIRLESHTDILIVSPLTLVHHDVNRLKITIVSWFMTICYRTAAMITLLAVIMSLMAILNSSVSTKKIHVNLEGNVYNVSKFIYILDLETIFNHRQWYSSIIYKMLYSYDSLQNMIYTYIWIYIIRYSNQIYIYSISILTCNLLMIKIYLYTCFYF